MSVCCYSQRSLCMSCEYNGNAMFGARRLRIIVMFLFPVFLCLQHSDSVTASGSEHTADTAVLGTVSHQ